MGYIKKLIRFTAELLAWPQRHPPSPHPEVRVGGNGKCGFPWCPWSSGTWNQAGAVSVIEVQ